MCADRDQIWVSVIPGVFPASGCAQETSPIWNAAGGYGKGLGMGILSLGDLLFNIALGLYIPPGFENVKYGLFIIFCCLCVLVAIYFYVAYPDTCQKSLEEIELMFSKAGPRPWQTRKGESRIDDLIAQAREKQYTLEDAKAGRSGSTAEKYVELATETIAPVEHGHRSC